MAWVSSICDGLLAGIFIVSGLSKARRPLRAALALRNFRVIRRVRPGIGRLVGAIEFAAAVAVLIAPWAWGAYLPVDALLTIFVILIARSLARGEDFACACFGETGSHLSTWSLLRTGGLLAMALGVSVASTQNSFNIGVVEHIRGISVGVCLSSCCFLIGGLVQTAPFRTRIADA